MLYNFFLSVFTDIIVNTIQLSLNYIVKECQNYKYCLSPDIIVSHNNN